MTTANTTNNKCPHCQGLMAYEPCSIGLLTVCPACSYAYMEAKSMSTYRPNGPEDKSRQYLRAGIGVEYQKAEADCSKLVQAAKDGRNVYVVGGNGTGKSMLAASAAMALIDDGVGVMFVNAAVVVEEIKNSFDDGGVDCFERMIQADVLAIDDLGKGNPSDWEVSFWYSVVEARNAAQLPTIITTNYDGGKLIKRLMVKGDDSTAKAIVSRLRGGALVVRMDGDDLRLAV